jgi:hypothetical protein
MESTIAVLAGALGTMAFFGFLAFAAWLDYRKKKEDRDATHQEKMKALELGHAPLDAEIERARAYASAAWAAGLIGLLVPLAVVSLTVLGTIVAVLHKEPAADIFIPLVVAWSIAALLVLVAVMRSLKAIRQLPQPTRDKPLQAITAEKQASDSSAAFQGKPSRL